MKTMKILLASIILLMPLAFTLAESDVDIWNSIIDSRSNSEACSASGESCSEPEKELKGVVRAASGKSAASFEEKTPIKPMIKPERTTSAFNKIPLNIKNISRPAVKKESPYLKTCLTMTLGVLFGFVFLYFIRKRRK